MAAFFKNIDDVLNNTYYRRVVYTGKRVQIAYMNLVEGESIPSEIHEGIDQYIQVVSGLAYVVIDDQGYELVEGDLILIPAESKHYVENMSNVDLKLISIYSPPEHPQGRVDINP